MLKALGDAAGFKRLREKKWRVRQTPNGHHLVNKSDRDAVYLEIGTRSRHERCRICAMWICWSSAMRRGRATLTKTANLMANKPYVA